MKKPIPMLLFLLLSLCLSAPAHSQMVAAYGSGAAGQSGQQKKSVALRTVLANLEASHKISILFDGALVENRFVTDRQAQINPKSKPEAVLDHLLKDTGLAYRKVNDTYYILRVKGESEPAAPASPATQPKRVQDRPVSGRVTSSENGEGLPGVSVVVKGTSIGASTDPSGNFQLSVPDENAVLVFSYIGFVGQEVTVGGQSSLTVQLAPDVKALEELVVVGYGTQKRRDLTGSVARVNPSETATLPNVNPSQALRGTVAGVSVVDNGRPGSDGSIIIRGQTSISATNAPLIVLDGIIYTGGLSDINTNDIESMDILKDASSAAVYGSRATNGVILITTKRGTSTKPRLTYNAYQGISDYAHTLNMMGPERYIQMKKDGAVVLNRPFILTPTEEANFQAGRTIDPWEAISQNAPMSNHEMSLSGKTERVNYYVSGSYTDMKSKLYGDNFSRLSFRANLDIMLTDWLSIGTNSGYSVKDYSGIRADLNSASYISPYSTFFHEDGAPKYLPYDDGLAINPLFNSVTNDNKNLSSTLFNNTYAEVKLPLPGLVYRLNTGNNIRFNEEYNYAPAYDRDGIFRLGSGRKAHHQHHYLMVENILKYNYDIGNSHSFDFTALYSFERTNDQSSTLSSNNIFSDALSYNGLGIGENQTVQTTAMESRAVSGMARVGYRLLNRYLFNATIRRDGYSAFGEGRKYGNFPSIGVGWLLSEENFMAGIPWVDHLKVRYSYGKNGNRGIGPYSSLSNMNHTSNQYVFGDGGATAIGISPTSMPNSLLGWETTTASNLGVDFSVIRSRISGAVEVYNMNTSDLLLNLRIPNMTGYETFFTNVGSTNNKGIEVTLNTVNFSRGDFNWSTRFVLTANRNKITRLSGIDLDGDGREDDDIASQRFIGHPLGTNFDYVVDGIWQVGDDFGVDPGAQPGYLRFVDVNGDGKIGPEDRQVLHSSQPDFLSGLTNTFSYKGFSLLVLFNGRFGGYSPNDLLNHGTNFYDRANLLDLPYWMPENPLTDRPSLNYPNPRGYRFYESRTFVRLQDVSLSYTFNQDLVSKLRLNNLQVYISGKNLVTWTDWKGWDPEHGGGGRFPANGPLLKSYVLGLSLGL